MNKQELLGHLARLDAALIWYAWQRALNRFALYQAKARAFGMVSFLDNLRRHLGRPALEAAAVPPHLVSDIGLPPLRRERAVLGKAF